MTDGLCMVNTDQFSASFEIRGGRVTRCAPILRRRLSYWLTVAERIGDLPSAEEA